MILYIWLIWHQLVIYCAAGAGCIQSSVAHFDYITGIGALELLFEISGIIKIFTIKKDFEKNNEKKEE